MKKAIFPGCYMQGAGVLKNLSLVPELKGRKLFILASKSAIEKVVRPNLDDWASYCEVIYEKFRGECCWNEIDRTVALLDQNSYDFVAGMGGGKAIDTARVAARKKNIPFISIPTIAATDAPTASACVVYDEHGVIVDYFTTKNPDYVIVDTKVIAEAPVRFLISGMGDALATWFEADTCDKQSFENVAGGYNLRALMAIAGLCYDNLVKYGVAAVTACENNIVTHALDYIVETNILLSGLGFESGGLSTAHGIHDCLCHLKGTHDYFHGEKVAIGTQAGLFLENKPLELVEEVYSFCESVGLPTTLDDIGVGDVTNEELSSAINAVLSNQDSYIHHVRFELNAAHIVEALRMADAIGKKRKTATAQ